MSVRFTWMRIKSVIRSEDHARCIPGRGRKGAALIIVLAFIVLLTGIIIAFFRNRETLLGDEMDLLKW